MQPGHGRRTVLQDFAAFVTSQFLPKSVDDIETRRRLCPSFVCAIVQWARQVQGLATALQSQSGESVRQPCYACHRRAAARH